MVLDRFGPWIWLRIWAWKWAKYRLSELSRTYSSRLGITSIYGVKCYMLPLWAIVSFPMGVFAGNLRIYKKLSPFSRRWIPLFAIFVGSSVKFLPRLDNINASSLRISIVFFYEKLDETKRKLRQEKRNTNLAIYVDWAGFDCICCFKIMAWMR